MFPKNWRLYVLTIIWVTVYYGGIVKRVNGETSCDQEDYRPCLCTSDGVWDLDDILCKSEISSNVTTQDIKEVFDRILSTIFGKLDLSDLTDPQKEIWIPNNFISNKVFTEIDITCILYQNFIYKIAPNAFKSSSEYTTRVQITACYLQPDFGLSFIEGFSKLTMLEIESAKDMGNVMSTFPIHLPSMINLKMTNCLGWNSMKTMPSAMEDARNVLTFYLTGSFDMNDNVMNMMMEWVAQSFNSTLESLFLYSNNLTKIPEKTEYLVRLKTFDIRNNSFPWIASHSLRFNTEKMKMIISGCGIQDIEQGAFQGKFNGAYIDLSNNKLTRLESTVFEDVLKGGGTVDINNNPIDCNADPCHLAWIFNQNLQNLIANGARCSNGTPLAQLDLSYFVECYVYSTTDSTTPTENRITNATLQPSSDLITINSSFSTFTNSTLPSTPVGHTFSVTAYYTREPTSTFLPMETFHSLYPNSSETKEPFEPTTDVTTQLFLQNNLSTHPAVNGAQKIKFYSVALFTIFCFPVFF